MDENSIQGLTGLIYCQIIEGQLGVEEQLDSLEEFNKSTGMSKVRAMDYSIVYLELKVHL